jgi:hypothetical protein
LNSGNFLPVANASSATLIKSIFCIELKIVYRSCATWSGNSSAQTTAVTPKSGCKVTLFSSISQIFNHFS